MALITDALHHAPHFRAVRMEARLSLCTVISMRSMPFSAAMGLIALTIMAA